MPTDNHNLNTPSEGTTDWHIPLNENFEAIDVGLPIWEPDSNRDGYTPHRDAVFVATDTGNVYLGDGDAWGDPVFTIGEESGSTGDGSALDAYRMDLVSQNLNARDGRPMFTTDDRTIHVDPAEGSDSNDGTADAPLKTLKKALWITPWFLQHEWTIDLADGIYHNADEGNQILGPVAIIDGWQRRGTKDFFLIEGNPESPRNVEVQAGLSLCHWGPEEDNENINGIYFRGDINNKNGNLTINNCVFDASLDTANHALQGKGAGITHFKNCEFDGVEHVVHFGELGGYAEIGKGCTGTATQQTFWLGGGARGVVKRLDTIGALGTYAIDNGAQFYDPAGTPRNRDVQTREDFMGQYPPSRENNYFDEFRPRWDDASAGGNSPSFDAGTATFPDGSSDPSRLSGAQHLNVPSSVRFRYQWQDTPTSGRFTVRFCFDHADFFEIVIDNDGDRRVTLRKNATFDGAIVSGRGSTDTAMHELAVTRSENGDWAILEDGARIATASDRRVPNRDNPWEYRLENSANAALAMEALEVGTYRA